MPRKRVNASSASHPSDHKIEETIIHNLVQLQKINADLAEKFDKMHKELVVLLNLFETAAKKFAEMPSNQTTQKDKDFLEKVDKLLEQNKTIAKGLTLVEERMREKVYGSPQHQQNQPVREEREEYSSSMLGKPLPKF
ncbi:MAG: hypothetical protein AABW80_02945 [Nanoarchaeota archaeon]